MTESVFEDQDKREIDGEVYVNTNDISKVYCTLCWEGQGKKVKATARLLLNYKEGGEEYICCCEDHSEDIQDSESDRNDMKVEGFWLM